MPNGIDGRRIAVFVTNEAYLNSSGGGVQWCTRDYKNTIESAGYNVKTLTYRNESSWISKFQRKLSPAPFQYLVPKKTVSSIERLVREQSKTIVFLNNSEPLVLAPELRRALSPDSKIIFCSHGAESTDLHNTRIFEPGSLPFHARRPAWLGRVIAAEAKQRQALNGTICISQDDVIYERWLGSPRVLFLPRSVEANPLDRNPVQNRFGTVSTLNHVPNLDGIRKLAAAIENFPELRFRVAGGPTAVGERLATKFSCIEYVGRVDDDELKSEVSTWKCFVNPVFCQGRGASTKVATALGWGLPVASTKVGVRGYVWDEDEIPTCETPLELASLVHKMCTDDDETWTQRTQSIFNLAPNVKHSGSLVRAFVASLEENDIQLY